ncbi:hemolysin-type lysine-binding protein [Desulfobacula toluolica]|uniref:Putative hemolysin-type lysine-binding protein n=1 Tax=Desulfobacula toluolica (strain DSM 7467 / Tol2) TaxID=651182 RepID=K0NHN1_DESTT|nr:hemolysin-type lysine-binding protein [Desulfobacula toluolica]CCK80811.1 putative hemolysin-type lysine-binding protein [Desulfobacula toluolica Tol2]
MAIDSNIITDMGQLSALTYKNYPSESSNSLLNKGKILQGTFNIGQDSFSLNNSYTVKDYADTPSDMQALLLEKNDSTGNPTGEYIIAFRGTQEKMDIGVDAIIGLANYNPQFNDAKAFVQQMMTDHNISSSNLTLTGHSLGAILTQSVGAVLGIKGYAYNPYGTERLLTMWESYTDSLGEALIQVGIYQVLNAFGLDSSYAQFAADNILNVSFNDCGTLNGGILSNFASELTSDHLGTYLPVFGDNEGLSGHSMVVLNNAISYYNEIIAHFTDETDYDDLSTAYALSGENGFNRLNNTFGKLDIAHAAGNSLQFKFLDKSSITDFQSQASDQAHLFSLRALNPFAIIGANYSIVNENGELDIDNYSDKYIEDRSTFLYYLAHPDEKLPSGEDTIQFTDKRLGINTTAWKSGIGVDLTIRDYFWGTEVRDEFGSNGNTGDDHLYGMGGNDTLKGYGGEDYIEGGEGQDTMYGGGDKDTFYIQGEDDDYDIFNGGDHNEDTILGSEGNDTIRVHDFSGENTVEIIDGRGGENVIAGTGMVDTIDMSGTALIDIDRIEGGDGADTIKGCLADDTIYGGSKDQIEDNAVDQLEGGAGNDIYYAGTGDVINDLDGRGTVWFEGRELSGLTWTGLSPDSNIYSDSDENYYALFDNTSNTLIVSHSSTNHYIKIENFSDGTLGLTLEDYTPPSDYDYTLIGSADDDESDYHPDYDLGTYSYGFGDNADITADMSTSISLEIYGGAGSDYILGLPWDDYLNGGGGDDHIVSNSNSTMAPDIVGDVMDGGDGNDLIQDTGNVGSVMLGGAGFDILNGYRGNDTMSGGSQTDVLTGHAGDDYLSGGDGNDVLLGDNDLFWTNSIMGMLGPNMVDFTFDQAGWITDVNFNGAMSVKDGDTITVTGIGGGDIYFDIPAGNDFLDGGNGNDHLYD